MSRQVLFFQGAGDDGYNADKAMVESLKNRLGRDYSIEYDAIECDESLPDYGWTQQMLTQMAAMQDNFFLAGHSLGASMILKCLSEHTISKNIRGIFLLSTPFWNGDEACKAAFILKENFANHLPVTQVFFYHCLDDDTVPVTQLESYKQKLPGAMFREIKTGGHQLNNDLSLVAQDIQSFNW
jgi:predicted alpha/beta hydrolase family esterase